MTAREACASATICPNRYLNQYDTSLVHHVAPGWDRWFVMTSDLGGPDYYVSGMGQGGIDSGRQ